MKNIVCFGNSITYGQGAKPGEDYPSLLRSLTNNNVVNSGIPGDTTKDGLRRIDKDVLEKDPFLVIVEFSANDYFKNLPKEETVANLKEVILKVQNVGAMVALCDVSGAWDIFGRHDIYHSQMKKLAKETNSIFISRLMKDILRDSSLRVDSFHPNAKGYQLLADRIFKAIKPFLF